ncbi:ankyrin repeat-containing domain protein [Xylariales sp. PMI_506]|nr:ankyrin repeat-containing domain protein [Xylariales sp. PMI_506]
MRLINVKTRKLEEFFDDYIPTYAILSHTWGTDYEEVAFRDVEEGAVISGPAKGKFNGACSQAECDKLGYLWIDTCCIDKTNSVELGEAINSMFRWYRNAAYCYAYLSDVAAEDCDDPSDQGSSFRRSRWFQRGWTLQELLAPRNVRFYDKTWSYLGTKRQLSLAISSITGIARHFLLGMAELHEASVAQRMSWAASRVTTRREDRAYSLLGLFDVTMPMIYGEGDQAFMRLQEEILRRIRDDSILAWGLSLAAPTKSPPTARVSDGIFASSPMDFAHCGKVVAGTATGSLGDSFYIYGGALHIRRGLHTYNLGGTFLLLRCHLDQDPDQPVGIPVGLSEPDHSDSQYIRIRGYPATLVSSRVSGDAMPRSLQIRTDRDLVSVTTDQRCEYYLDNSLERQLELVEVEPNSSWDQDADKLLPPAETIDGSSRIWARLRYTKGENLDFVLVLTLTYVESEPQLQQHVMLASRTTGLREIKDNFDKFGPEALVQHNANNGVIGFEISTSLQRLGASHLFLVELTPTSKDPDAGRSVDASSELERLELEQQFTTLLDEQDELLRDLETLDEEITPKTEDLAKLKNTLDELDDRIGKLIEERALVQEKLDAASQDVEQLRAKPERIRQRTKDISRKINDTRNRLEDLDEDATLTERVGRWPARIIKMMLENAATASEEKIGHVRQDIPRLILGTALAGKQETLGFLLEEGAGIKGNTEQDQSPTLQASQMTQNAILKKLMDKKVDFEAADEQGRTALLLAAKEGNIDVVKLLVALGSDLETHDKMSMTPLITATKEGHTSVVQILLAQNVNVESRDFDGWTALAWAAKQGHEDIVRLLTDKRANVQVRNNRSWTPLMIAADQGHTPTVKLLLDNGAALEAHDETAWTALFIAVHGNHKDTVQILLDHGADKEHKILGQTSLSWAAAHGRLEVAKLLLNSGAKFETEDGNNQTPLSLASMNGHELVVRLLLAKAVDLNSRSLDGLTPLMWAAQFNHPQVALLLLNAGANPRLESSFGGRTALAIACEQGQQKVARALLPFYTHIEAKDYAGRTALALAAENGHEAVVQLLLQRHANIESRDNNELTPFLLAANRGHDGVVKLLTGGRTFEIMAM